jgi:hypothetical protein
MIPWLPLCNGYRVIISPGNTTGAWCQALTASSVKVKNDRATPPFPHSPSRYDTEFIICKGKIYYLYTYVTISARLSVCSFWEGKLRNCLFRCYTHEFGPLPQKKSVGPLMRWVMDDFLQSLKWISGYQIKTGHDRFFSIAYNSVLIGPCHHSTVYSLRASLNKP